MGRYSNNYQPKKTSTVPINNKIISTKYVGSYRSKRSEHVGLAGSIGVIGGYMSSKMINNRYYTREYDYYPSARRYNIINITNIYITNEHKSNIITNFFGGIYSCLAYFFRSPPRYRAGT